jgi:hypothetical protein
VNVKSIVVYIEDDLYEKLRKDAGFVAFTEDCVPISTADRCMHRIVQKIEQGNTEVTLSFTKKEKP